MAGHIPLDLEPASTSQRTFSPPSSILIIGSGVFGLTTALSLSQNPVFALTTITLVDRSPNPGEFPSPDAASVDTSRIIRADYKDPLYTHLAAQAQVQWRDKSSPASLGIQGRYSETGLVVVGDVESPNISYIRDSFTNALSLATTAGKPNTVKELPGPDYIKKRARTGGWSGNWGYVNETSGWADAAASMTWLFAKVRDSARVNLVQATVSSLATTNDHVTGAVLHDGRVLNADLVILAAGAWTGELIDLAGQVAATAQVVAYLPISAQEQEKLFDMPVLLDISTGYFVIPPSNRILKIARHAYGYRNPTVVQGLLPSGGLQDKSHITATVSRPWTVLDDPHQSIPVDDARDLHAALRQMVPLEGLEFRHFTKTRLCWYADTPTGDFLVDYHPKWKGLFVATGDSGHAFKFLPILGDKVVECILGDGPPDMRKQWSWAHSQKHKTGDNVATDDGSRAGEPGRILEQLYERVEM